MKATGFQPWTLGALPGNLLATDQRIVWCCLCAEDAAEAVRERSAGALAAARDTVASARDSVTGAVQAAEDKAKQAYEQTKGGLVA
jgi:hypothetical protein